MALSLCAIFGLISFGFFMYHYNYEGMLGGTETDFRRMPFVMLSWLVIAVVCAVQLFYSFLQMKLDISLVLGFRFDVLLAIPKLMLDFSFSFDVFQAWFRILAFFTYLGDYINLFAQMIHNAKSTARYVGYDGLK
mmetsp:Transcript_134088/g.286721  ORF Transcript_134088/g.286721 Transcript_134088/m.286721 type:complete len:135 (-) Transcript_134088:71-475(-)